MSFALISHNDCHLHNMGDFHPESPARLDAISDQIIASGVDPFIRHLDAPLATREQLERVHDSVYVQHIFDIAPTDRSVALDPDTVMNPYTLKAALRAAGAVVYAVDLVMKGKIKTAFCSVRPPGHHAEHNKAMGFCIFNNIAVGVAHALAEYGLKRIAIVDFDVHHGNGTQAILNEDPTVMFVSSHQYPYYPGTGALGDIGLGEASGTKVNLPLSPHVGDEGFKQLYGEVVFPLLRRFQPELILVSAGFDAHWDDPLASISLSLTGYHWLCRSLVDLAAEICCGRIVFTLEGGYNLDVLAPGVGNAFRVLLGSEECDDPLGPSPWPEPEVSVSILKETHNLP